MARLSKRTVGALQPHKTDYFLWDDTLPGFGVRVLTTGRKTFVAQYRALGRTRRVTIGRYGVLTAEEARKQAVQILGSVAKGDDPASALSDYRRTPTVASVCDRFLAEHVAERCKPRTQGEYRRTVERFIKPAFGPRKITDITRSDVAELHHQHRKIPYQANRTLGVLSKMFNLTEVWGLRPDGSNPCRHVQKYKEHKRERFLSPEEISRLFAVLDDADREGRESSYATAAYRLLLLTGCRLSEIQTLMWSDIDEHFIWLRDSKTGTRKIPISQAVRTTLAEIPRLPDNPHVIVGKVPGQHIMDLQHPWRRIRERAGLAEVRIHDLRHTYASHALASGLSLELIGKLLGHTQFQTTMRYAHLADGPLRTAADQVALELERHTTAHLGRKSLEVEAAARHRELVEFEGPNEFER